MWHEQPSLVRRKSERVEGRVERGVDRQGRTRGRSEGSNEGSTGRVEQRVVFWGEEGKNGRERE